MPWYSQCSWCGGPFNGENCRRYTNMSFGEEFVRNPDPISNDETLEFSYPPPQPSMNQTRVRNVGTILTMAMIVRHGSRLSMSRNRATIKKKPIEREQEANLAVQKEQEEQAVQSFTPYWNFPMINYDDEEYTIQYREYLENSSKAIEPVLPIEEPNNSLSMGDKHLSTIPETESGKVTKSSVKDLISILSESKGISDDICDVPFCDNDHFDAEFGLFDSLLSRDISITSPKIDFLLEEFAALNHTPYIPFVLEYTSFSPIPVVDSDFLIEEVDTFLVLEDSIPPGIESDFDSEGDIIFLDDLLNDDPIPEYERFTFDIEPDEFKTFLSLPEAETL
ncbi:hypothetical protein Tco_0820021 [Tanacetum coccineum]|uniref:Reverse transcriptase domain-containing protein n=1 Tax=Tanacetum coccineum TaxID=301880 RepID=A0ABQ5AB43_9ASTR